MMKTLLFFALVGCATQDAEAVFDSKARSCHNYQTDTNTGTQTTTFEFTCGASTDAETVDLIFAYPDHSYRTVVYTLACDEGSTPMYHTLTFPRFDQLGRLGEIIAPTFDIFCDDVIE